MSDGILSRWARRKQAVRQQERARAVPQADEASGAVEADSEAGALSDIEANPQADEELAEAIARLPKLEDLTAETDLAPFLRAGIPSALRNAALRRMWSVDPGIRDFVSEAREYAYDWNTPGGVPGLGPMLPTDDIKAMVERIMTGAGPKPAPTPLEPGDTREPDADPDTQRTAEDQDVVELAETLPAPAVSDAHRPHVAAPEPLPITVAGEEFQSPTIVSRMRRHGGAMPS